MGIQNHLIIVCTISLIYPQITKLVFTDPNVRYIMDPNISIC